MTVLRKSIGAIFEVFPRTHISGHFAVLESTQSEVIIVHGNFPLQNPNDSSQPKPTSPILNPFQIQPFARSDWPAELAVGPRQYLGHPFDRALTAADLDHAADD